MANRREMQALITLAGRMSPSLERALRQTQRGIGGVTSSSNLMGKAMNKGFKLVAKGAAIGVAALSAGVGYLAKEGLKLASDLNEVQNVVDVTFGKNSPINSWSQTALKQFGLSELAARQYSGTIGAMLKSSGISSKSLVTMSENIAGLTGDFASFYNINQDDAFTKIRSGISGETEPLKQLGINMSVANLEAYALSQGIKTSYQKMNQASQMTLRYNYLLKVSKDAQGDFNRTQSSFANQSRLLKTNIQQLSAKIMSAALPGFTKLIGAGNKLLNGFFGNPEIVKKAQDIVTNGMDKLVQLMPSIVSGFNSLIEKLKFFYSIGVKVFKLIVNNWPLIEPIIWGIVAAQVALNVAAKGALIFQTITKAMELASAAMVFYRNGATLAQIAQWALNIAMDANPIGLIIVGIGLAVTAIALFVKNIDKIKEAFLKMVNFVTSKINWLIDKLNMIPGVNIPLIPQIKITSETQKAMEEMKSGNLPKTTSKVASINQKPVSSNKTTFIKPVQGKMFASGGLANKASIFGEAGPEMAIPIKYKSSRSLSLLNQTAKAIGADTSSGNSPVQLVYSPTIMGGDAPQLESILKSHADELIAMIDNYFAEKARLVF